MSDPKDFRILIVDDTVKNIQVLGTVLKEQGYQINVAQNGQQALDQVEKVKPDLILLDVMMPEMDGFEACRHLKANPNTEEIPVIFLTAKVETEDVVKGFELGAVDYVTKPFNPTELLVRVDTHLSLYHLRRKLEDLVAERTAQLQHRVRELDASDRLMHLQMSTPPLSEVYENILHILEDVLKVGKAAIYRPDEAGERLVIRGALGFAESGQIQIDPEGDAVDLDDTSPVARAFREQKPAGEDGEGVATPILYDDKALGVLWIDRLESDELDEDTKRDAFWRLGQEAALTIRAAQVAEDLDAGDLDVTALLNVDLGEN